MEKKNTTSSTTTKATTRKPSTKKRTTSTSNTEVTQAPMDTIQSPTPEEDFSCLSVCDFISNDEKTSLSAAIRDFLAELDSSKDIIDRVLIDRVSDYYLVLKNKAIISSLQRVFLDLWKVLNDEYPDLHFRIDGRFKSFTSFMEKVNRTTYESLKNPNDENRRANVRQKRVKDIIAFRVTFDGENEEELREMLTDIANRIFEVLSEEQDCIPIKTDNPSASNGYIKNYLLNPKANGYKSIQWTMYSPSIKGSYDGIPMRFPFEIQVRTAKMNIDNEISDGDVALDHDSYKKNRNKIPTRYSEEVKKPVYRWKRIQELRDNPELINIKGVEVQQHPVTGEYIVSEIVPFLRPLPIQCIFN